MVDNEFSPLQKKQFYSPNICRNKLSRYMKPSNSVSGSSKLLNSFQQRLERFRTNNSSGPDESRFNNKSSYMNRNESSMTKNTTPNTKKSYGSKNGIKDIDYFSKEKNFFGSVDQDKENKKEKTPLSALLSKSNFTKNNMPGGFPKGRPCSSDTRFAKSYRYGKNKRNVRKALSLI